MICQLAFTLPNIDTNVLVYAWGSSKCHSTGISSVVDLFSVTEYVIEDSVFHFADAMSTAVKFLFLFKVITGAQ